MNRGRPVGEANGDGPFWPVSMATSPAAHLRRAVVIREIRHPWSTSAGETRRPPSHLNSYTRFIAFLDDASRVCCHGQFFLAENVDTLIESLRAAFYKRGVPQALYVDNGSIYSSKEIIQICARVGCLLVHTPVRDGAAKGKIERFFRTVREQFLSRSLDLSSLDALNRRFIQWVEEDYNARTHSVLQMTPLDRFALDRGRVRYLPPNQANDELFFIEEERTVRADNTFSFKSIRFEAPRHLPDRTIQIRFERKRPTHRVIVFYKGERMGEAKPLDPVANDRKPITQSANQATNE